MWGGGRIWEKVVGGRRNEWGLRKGGGGGRVRKGKDKRTGKEREKGEREEGDRKRVRGRGEDKRREWGKGEMMGKK